MDQVDLVAVSIAFVVTLGAALLDLWRRRRARERRKLEERLNAIASIALEPGFAESSQPIFESSRPAKLILTPHLAEVLKERGLWDDERYAISKHLPLAS